MSFRLQTLLEIRRRTEDQAERALATAVAARAAAEREQERLDECAAAARHDLEAFAYDGTTAGSALDGERYRSRLAEHARTARLEALTHRKGALAREAGSEEEAREALLAARRDRQSLDRLEEREAHEQRRLVERRTEDDAGDRAASRRPPRG